MRENLKSLASIPYEPSQVTGNEAKVASIIVYHPVKKQETKLLYTLVKDKAVCKALDVAILGGSMLGSFRDDQVRSLLKEDVLQPYLKPNVHRKDQELASVRLN